METVGRFWASFFYCDVRVECDAHSRKQSVKYGFCLVCHIQTEKRRKKSERLIDFCPKTMLYEWTYKSIFVRVRCNWDRNIKEQFWFTDRDKMVFIIFKHDSRIFSDNYVTHSFLKESNKSSCKDIYRIEAMKLKRWKNSST